MRWLRSLLERFRPAEVPQGWDVRSLKEIRPQWNEPLSGEVVVVDPHLGPLAIADLKPVRAWLFEATRELHPVDLAWRPAWAEAL